MKLLTYMLGLLTIVALQGCTTLSKITAQPKDNQKIVYKDGRETIFSVKKNTIALAPKADTVASGQRGDFVIAVNNGTSNDIIFSTENITATSKNKKTGEIVSLKVYTYKELVEEEKSRQAWAAFAAALQGAADSMNASNAGYKNTYGTYSGTAYSNYGNSAYGYGSYSSTTYDYGAAQAAQNAAQAKSEARIDRLQAEGRANLQNLASTILKKETVFPKAWHGGMIKVQIPEVAEAANEIYIMVYIEGEDHKFVFLQEEIKENISEVEEPL